MTVEGILTLLCSNWKCPTPLSVPRCHASQQTDIVTASLYVRLPLVILTTRQRKIWAGAEGSLYRNPPRHGQVDCVWLGGPLTQASRHVFIWSRPPADYLIPGSTLYTIQIVAWNCDVQRLNDCLFIPWCNAYYEQVMRMDNNGIIAVRPKTSAEVSSEMRNDGLIHVPSKRW